MKTKIEADMNVSTSAVRALSVGGFAFTFTGRDPEQERDTQVTVRFHDPSWLKELARQLREVLDAQEDQLAETRRGVTEQLAA